MPTDSKELCYIENKIRKSIKALEEGKEPTQPQQKNGQTIRTYGQDTVSKSYPKEILMIVNLLNQLDRLL